MIVYICVKVATQEEGTYIFVQTEAAFADKSKAEHFFSQRASSWKEVVDGISCECVRALHEVELTQ